MSVDVKALFKQMKKKDKAGDGSSDKNNQPSKRLNVVNNPLSAPSPALFADAGGGKPLNACGEGDPSTGNPNSWARC